MTLHTSDRDAIKAFLTAFTDATGVEVDGGDLEAAFFELTEET